MCEHAMINAERFLIDTGSFLGISIHLVLILIVANCKSKVERA